MDPAFLDNLNAIWAWATDLTGTTQRWMWAGIALVVGYLGGVIVALILKFAARKISGLTQHKPADGAKSADHIMIDIMGAMVRGLFLLIAGVVVAWLLFGVELDAAYGVGVGATKGVAILALTWFIGSWLASRVRKFGDTVARGTHAGNKTMFHFLSSVVRFAAFAIGLVAALHHFGLDTTSLLAVMGAAGLAIALSLQDTLKSVAAGVVIAIFRPYRIGDFVTVGGQAGTVAEITPFTTVLNTIDNREVILTNDKCWGDVMINHSSRSMRRLDLLFSIAYEDSIEEALGAIRKTLESDPRVRKEPPIWMKVQALAASSVDIRVRAWCSSHDFGDLQGDMLKAVKEAFDTAGITIPYPTQANVTREAPASPPAPPRVNG